MKITRFDCFAYELTYAHGEYVMSGGRAATTQPGTLVRLVSDDGQAGWGEATPLAATYLPTHAGGVRAALEYLAPTVVGCEAGNVRAIQEAVDAAMLGNLAAKSAIDIACWDLFGRISGLSVTALLGGSLSSEFPLYEAIPLGTPDAMVEFARRRHAAGIDRFQLKVGDNPVHDVARTAAVAVAMGSEVTVIADANGGWSLADARRAIRDMRELDVWVEQPCRSLTDCGLAAAGSDLRLILDECVVTPEDLVRAKEYAGASAVNIKLSRVGGLTRGSHLRDLASELNLLVCLEDTWGGDVITSAVSHLAATTRGRNLLTTSFFNDWTDGHVAGYRPRSRHGVGAAPTAPGLGIEVDEAALGAPLFSVKI